METKPFAELTLSPKVLAAVEAAGYTTATPIQSAAIPVAVAGLDVLGIAQTGTGKTAAFTLPMITRLEHGRARARMPRSLILAPTRELAAQVAQAFEKYGTNHKLDVALLIGGVSMDDQVKKLDRGVDVLIATPGRLLDHFGRGRVMLMGVEILVIDEADRMLDMGFIPDIEKICKLLPPKRQTLFFSATMPPEITRLADQFLKNPVRVEVAKPATTAKTITQRFRFAADGEDWAKREVLRDLIKSEAVRNAIIFCNRKRDVAILLKSLLKHGFNAGALHGDMDQKSRTETLDKFRSGEITLLAASDVAARGLDIPDVSHVFNFDLPWQSDDYVHRIGRTGRAGKLGTSLSIVTHEDLKLFQDIQKMLGEPGVWIGEAPTEEDFANAGKRKRGRFGRGGKPGGPRDARGGSEGRQGREHGDGRPPREGRTEQPRRDRPRAGDMLRASLTPEAGGESAVETSRPPRAHRLPRRADIPEGQPAARAPQTPGAGPQPEIADHAPPQPARDPSPPRDQREPRREHREPREKREPRRDRDHRDQPPAAARQQDDTLKDRPRPAATRPPRQDRGPDERPRRDREESGPSVGFADNVPAFLRKSSRPAKAANE